MAIIGISGYSGVGKDLVGQMIQNSDPSKLWEIKKFAGKLKTIASMLTGIPERNFEDQEFKKTSLGPEWDVPATASLVNGIIDLSEMRPMTVREFLQKLGTNAIRNGLHSNTWVNALMADYECVPADRAPGGWDCDNWVITDVRFPNEAKAIKDKGGVIIRIDRPGIRAINAHPSETSLDQWDFDYKIANVSDTVALEFTVLNILKELKLYSHDTRLSTNSI